MRKKYFSIIFMLFLISLASASFVFSDSSTQKNYLTDSDLISSINISFANEPLTKLFTDSLGNSITLKQALDNSPLYIYNCSFQNCSSDYSGTNSTPSKSFAIAANQEKLIGLVLNGDLQKINSLSFSLTSDAQESNKNQIKIDILDDGIIETGNTKKGIGIGKVNYGCFNESKTSFEISFLSQPFCEKVSLNETPGLWLGAWVKKETTGVNKIRMDLYDLEGNQLKNCTLPTESLPSEGAEIFCEVDFLITEPTEYYICAEKEIGSAGYRTIGQDISSKCGFLGTPPKEESATYKIGAKQKNFGAVGTINIQDLLPSGEKASDLIEDYLISKYNGNCTNTCYIPIKISSSINQGISVSDLNLNYDKSSFPNIIESNYYDFQEIPSSISSSSQWLKLDNLFKLTKREGTINYYLKFDLNKLFEESLEVKEIPMTFGPNRAIAGVSTNFNLNLEEELNVSSYEWNFGDNSTITTTDSNVFHTYSEIKNYTINVALNTSLGKLFFSKVVEIGSAKDILNSSLENAKNSLNNLQKEILKLSLFESSELKKAINLDNFSLQLSSLEKQEHNATLDSEYTQIYGKFLNINFPISFTKLPVGSSFYLPEDSSINLDVLSNITGKEYSDLQSTYDYIRFWNKQNLDSVLSSNKFSILSEDGSLSELTIFELSIAPKSGVSEDYYFLIKDSENVNLKDKTKFKVAENYNYLKLGKTKEIISYSVFGSVSIENLPFISPSFLQEEFQEIPIVNPVDKTWIIILILAALILIVFTVYLILHKWYRVKYEKHLFPNKNQLYNAITYVNNSLKSGMDEEEIKKNLIKAGWKREQVGYILKRYAGKKIGMPGFSSKIKNENK